MSWAIKRLSADNAAAIGLNDRGLLRAGLKADINILDYDNLRLCRSEIVYDLPAGGKRLVQRTNVRCDHRLRRRRLSPLQGHRRAPQPPDRRHARSVESRDLSTSCSSPGRGRGGVEGVTLVVIITLRSAFCVARHWR